MEKEQIEGLDSLNQEEVVEPESTEVAEPETASEDLVKAKKDYENQKIRAEKAEQELKALKKAPVEKETPKNDMSLKDIRALSDVHDDDVDSVVDWAKFKGISVAEAKKSSEIQSLLRTREEERQTAQAANVGPAKRGSSKVSDEVLLERLSKGDLPIEDIDKAAKARLERKRQGLK